MIFIKYIHRLVEFAKFFSNEAINVSSSTYSFISQIESFSYAMLEKIHNKKKQKMKISKKKYKNEIKEKIR